MDPTLIPIVGLLVGFALLIAFVYAFIRERKAKAVVERRIAGILDLDGEVLRLQKELERLNAEIEDVRASYQSKKATYDQLQKELAIFDEKFAFAEMGFYEPHFEFTDSEEFKQAISKVREEQKRVISEEKL